MALNHSPDCYLQKQVVIESIGIKYVYSALSSLLLGNKMSAQDPLLYRNTFSQPNLKQKTMHLVIDWFNASLCFSAPVLQFSTTDSHLAYRHSGCCSLSESTLADTHTETHTRTHTRTPSHTS